MSFFTFVREQCRNLPVLATKQACAGATFIVTGSNNGLGYETAKHLVRLDSARVIMAVRNTNAGEAAKARMQAAHPASKTAVEVWPLDLASYDSVGAFAERADRQLDRIDAVVHNAAVALDRWSLSEGNETTMTINVYSPLLLAVLMLPQLSRASKTHNITPRMVFLSSEVAMFAEKELERIQGDVLGRCNDEKDTVMDQRYSLSKLVEMHAILELCRLAPVSRTGVAMNMVNPGLCWSSLNRNVRFTVYLQIQIMRILLGRSTEMGSRTELHGLTAGAESHGRYLSACEIKEDVPPSWVTDEKGQKLQRQIWHGVVKELEQASPGCVNKIL